MRKGMLGAIAVTVLLALYTWLIGQAVVRLVRTGEPVGVALGLALVVVPLLGVVYIGREWVFAYRVQKLSDRLHAEGALVVDDLPRSPGGRIDRTAADEAFARQRAVVEEHPDDWSAWFNLAWAYDAAGDRRRARETLRTAVRMARTADAAR